jgi:hypothetical protein
MRTGNGVGLLTLWGLNPSFIRSYVRACSTSAFFFQFHLRFRFMHIVRGIVHMLY